MLILLYLQTPIDVDEEGKYFQGRVKIDCHLLKHSSTFFHSLFFAFTREASFDPSLKSHFSASYFPILVQLLKLNITDIFETVGPCRWLFKNKWIPHVRDTSKIFQKTFFFCLKLSFQWTLSKTEVIAKRICFYDWYCGPPPFGVNAHLMNVL